MNIDDRIFRAEPSDSPRRASEDTTAITELLDTNEVPSRAIQKKKSRRTARIVLISLGALLIVALGFAAWAWQQAQSALSSIERDPELVTYDPELPIAKIPDGKQYAPLNIVVMGSDSRGSGDAGRSDVLMIAHINADRDKMYLISFPRDMYVDIPGRGKNKINAAYAYGGPPLVVRTLQKLVGMNMDHTAVIDMEEFVMITEVIGGVTINNRIASQSRGYTYPKGEITMAGDKLLCYVRERYGLPNGDLDRSERHRTVLRAIFLKLLNKDTLTNPAALQALINNVGSYFRVDDKLTNSEMISIAMSLNVSGGADIISLQAPIKGYGRSPANASIDIVHEKLMAELAEAIQNDTVAEYIERNGNTNGLTKG
ncbi:MAG: LCP family protein [Propionibacteriaceae bacterium]|nr:LCP family protein [Propionibacteriaceae bacterium]